MTVDEFKAQCRVVVRYGIEGEWKYLVLHDDDGTVFSEEQGAAFRFDSYENARAGLRAVVSNCEDPDIARTIRPVRLCGRRTVKRAS